jgi:ABC-type bacteriocin/lantibiotic exporter with double-glycine peptidase domain
LSSVIQQRSSEWLPPELVWLIKEIRPLLHWHLASFLCITLGSLLALLSPLLLKWLIDGIIPQRRIGLLLLAVALIFLGHQGRVALTSLGSIPTQQSKRRSQQVRYPAEATIIGRVTGVSMDLVVEPSEREARA